MGDHHKMSAPDCSKRCPDPCRCASFDASITIRRRDTLKDERESLAWRDQIAWEDQMTFEPVRVLPRINHIVFAYEEAVERFGDDAQAFLRAKASNNHHDLSFQRVAADAPAPGRGAVGLYHFALEVESFDDLLAARERLVALNALTAEFDTGATLSIYGRDPDGHTFEVMWEVPREAWGEYETRAGAKPLDIQAAGEKWSKMISGRRWAAN
jgi:catechol 2,3-dioxygenase-like lactoylglutathione lyase family enzyme